MRDSVLLSMSLDSYNHRGRADLRLPPRCSPADPLRGKVKLELGDPKPASAAHDAGARSDQAGQGHSDAAESGCGGVPLAVGEPSGLAGGSSSDRKSVV